jgi:hypothetical protein
MAQLADQDSEEIPGNLDSDEQQYETIDDDPSLFNLESKLSWKAGSLLEESENFTVVTPVWSEAGANAEAQQRRKEQRDATWARKKLERRPSLDTRTRNQPAPTSSLSATTSPKGFEIRFPTEYATDVEEENGYLSLMPYGNDMSHQREVKNLLQGNFDDTLVEHPLNSLMEDSTAPAHSKEQRVPDESDDDVHGSENYLTLDDSQMYHRLSRVRESATDSSLLDVSKQAVGGHSSIDNTSTLFELRQPQPAAESFNSTVAPQNSESIDEDDFVFGFGADDV